MKPNLFNIVGVSTGVGLLLLMLYSMWLTYRPVKTYEFNKITVHQTEVYQGDFVYFSVDFCRYTDLPVTSSRNLRQRGGGNIYPGLPIITLSPIGCRTVETNFPIPEETVPGTYYIESFQIIEVTNNRKVTTSYKTPEFEVKEATKSGRL